LVAPAKANRIYFHNGDDLSRAPIHAGRGLGDLVVASTTAEAIYAHHLHVRVRRTRRSTSASVHERLAETLRPKRRCFDAHHTGGRRSRRSRGAPRAPAEASNYPPISTTTDGKARTPVWFVNVPAFRADGDTGQEVFKTTGAACDSVPSMSFPIAVRNRIVVAALGHLCSWSPDGT
jgi:hypothetical protein